MLTAAFASCLLRRLRRPSLILVSMILYTGSYAIGLGNIPWLQGDLFRLEARGLGEIEVLLSSPPSKTSADLHCLTGTSASTFSNWSINLCVSSTYLSLLRRAGPAGTFSLYAGLCAFGWVFCYMIYPETSGLSLEEVFRVFEDGFGVRRAEEMRREKKAWEREIAARLS